MAEDTILKKKCSQEDNVIFTLPKQAQCFYEIAEQHWRMIDCYYAAHSYGQVNLISAFSIQNVWQTSQCVTVLENALWQRLSKDLRDKGLFTNLLGVF